MSGPKTSRYTITPEQRKFIEEQLRVMKETQEAQDRNHSLQMKATDNLQEIASKLRQLECLSNEYGYGQDETKKLNEQHIKLKTVLMPIIIDSSTRSLVKLKEDNDVIESIIKDIKDLNRAIKITEKRISVEYQQEIQEVAVTGFELSFEGLGNNRKNRQNTYINKINDALKEVEDIDLSKNLIDKLQEIRLRANAITNPDFLKNFYSLQVYPFVQECEFFRDHYVEYESLIRQYTALAKESGEQIRLFQFSEESIVELKNEIDRLTRIAVDQRAQIYISEAIDQAMLEMGYDLVGERDITRKNGRRFHNNLYVLNEGTAVNVTFSNSGQISMELGLLDTQDRTPTIDEATALVDDMRAFCDDYHELEKKLAAKGVVTQKLSLLPASSEYAQVFDVSEYIMKKPVTIYDISSSKRNTGKQLHKEV